ncbi:hypothetical protein PGT21_005794 [Puccinia graminis f. sp. tritici]|uniref:Uncharacterized protein n=1 Tax=Puccinia graminis f. sp. tritici TaxID=56615 RepID=A0A5B0PWX6_PUCGR|nr:hypothetical protein PGT21_005794 [Puccinia graminis f. sp. tritici]
MIRLYGSPIIGFSDSRPTQNTNNQNQIRPTLIQQKYSTFPTFPTTTCHWCHYSNQDYVVNQRFSSSYFFCVPRSNLHTIVREVKKSSQTTLHSPPDPSFDLESSDLSSISSRSEADSYLSEPDRIVSPKNGNIVSSQAWTPISTSGNPRKNTRKKTLQLESEPARYPEWTPEVSTYLNKPIKKKRKPRKNNRKGMAGTSPLNNSSENSNAENASSNPTAEQETNLLDYSEAMTRGTHSAQQQPSGFEDLGSSLPSITGTATRPQAAETLMSDQGISPALINSRATSLALDTMSNRSTPVPHPIDRQVFPVNSTTATGRQILSPTPHQPNPSPFLATSPSPVPLGPEDIIVDNQDLETVINLFNEQWNTFVQARENQNPRLMRMALVQAASSQEEIRLLAGGAEMLRICENWIAREELADLDRAQATSRNHSQRLAITQTAHEHTVSPSPAPQRSTRQSSDVTFLGTGQAPQRNNPLPPPPPPSTQPPSEVTRHKLSRQAHQYYQQPLPRYQQEGYYQQPQPQTRIVQNYAPQQTQVVPNQTHQQPPNPPQRGNWRGFGRNGRRPRDQTARLLEVGEYLMRAEQIAGRVLRVRGRGRARGRGRGHPHPQEEPPAQPRQ